MILQDGPHQSRLPSLSFFGVDVCSALNQEVYRFQVAGARGRHQSRLSTGVRGVGVDSCTKKAVDHRGIAVESREVDRRDTVTCSDVHFCARLDQQLGSFEIVLAGGPME